jgi:hypothetical protein
VSQAASAVAALMGMGGLGALAKGGNESGGSTPGGSAPVSHRLLGELDEGRDGTAAYDLYDLTDFDFTQVDVALLNSGRLGEPGTLALSSSRQFRGVAKISAKVGVEQRQEKHGAPKEGGSQRQNTFMGG